MSQLKRNLVANYLGQGWVAVMGLAFVPVYIRYLGMEAYALVGVYALMQSWLALLDAGMTPTLNREMARFTAGAHSAQSIADLLRSVEILGLGLAAVIGLGIWGASGYLANDWLRSGALTASAVADALAVMGLVVGLRFLEGIYRGALFGLHRQVWFNAVNAGLATARHGGAVAVVALVSPTIWAFFAWQAAVSVVTTLTFAAKVHATLPPTPARARFSRDALLGIRAYAGGMLGITALGLLLTQADKVILSRMLSLEDFGYYTLAATVAGTLYMVISPITQSLFPRMVELSTRQDESALISVYHQGAQLVTVLTAPAVMITSFFAAAAVFAWSGDRDLAAQTAPILAALALGTFLNGLMWIPHQCQLAYGWTSLGLRTNMVAVVVLIPAMLLIVPRYGGVGAAWLWVVLNAGYVSIALGFMHRRLLRGEQRAWYLLDVLLPVVGAGAAVAIASLWQPGPLDARWRWGAFLFTTGVLSMAAAAAFAPRLRRRAVAILQSSFKAALPMSLLHPRRTRR